MKTSIAQEQRDMRSFLMIAPHYPPCKAVAAKRALCFSRRLPEYGWRPAVIALPEHIQKDPLLVPFIPDVPMYRYYRGGPIAWLEDKLSPKEGRAVSVTHPSEVNTGDQALQTRSWLQELRGLPFDQFTKYIPTLIPGALRFLKRHRCELIYATGGPFSSFILAHALSKITSLPLVLDLRDPYTVDPIYTGRWSRWGLTVATRMEEWQFQRASKVILNTRTSCQAYVDAYEGRISDERFTFIRNHFDPELYEDPTQEERDRSVKSARGERPFSVVFFGHLTPIRNAGLFLSALRQLIDERSLSPDDIKFYTLKSRTETDRAQIEALSLAAYVEELDWSPFVKARAVLQRFDLLLDLTSERHYMRISGKLYDYLAARRPILCLSENEEMREIMRDTGAGRVVPNDQEQIVRALHELYDAQRSGEALPIDEDAVYAFSARPAAQSLADIFNQSTSR